MEHRLQVQVTKNRGAERVEAEKADFNQCQPGEFLSPVVSPQSIFKYSQFTSMSSCTCSTLMLGPADPNSQTAKLHILQKCETLLKKNFNAVLA